MEGYIVAVASGPVLVMPDQIIWHRSVDPDNGQTEQSTINQIISQYLLINDQLNDQIYEVSCPDLVEWSKGYLDGFGLHMTAWAPLLSEQPDLLKVIMATAEKSPMDATNIVLTKVARRVHAFWVAHRRHHMGVDGVLAQLISVLPAGTSEQCRRPH
jgi:hypothetical protein